MKTNAQQAYNNYKLWLSWYPQDFKGAIEFAGDCLDTAADVDEFEQLIKDGIEIKVTM